VTAPALSVVMPVHNAAPYLRHSIESILEQTFEDFELVILDNGSSDGSSSIVRRYAAQDGRIRLFEHHRPLGVAGSSNYLFARSKAPLVARMDADDVCRPERLELQLDVMRTDSDVVVVGALSDGIDAEGRRVRPRDRWRLIRCTEVPFSHGSAMVRREAFERVGGYRETAMLGQDVEFFLRLADCGPIVVLPDRLYSYRYHVDTRTASCPPAEAARSKQFLHRCIAARRAGRAYERVWDSAASEAPRAAAIADALYYQGTMRLWAGEPPGILAEVIRNGPFMPWRVWLKTLVWAVWSQVSPATLRPFLRGLVRARDLVAGMRLRDGNAYEWRLT
jgi:glycosyltransferase involved in cell wall biosynthesis